MYFHKLFHRRQLEIVNKYIRIHMVLALHMCLHLSLIVCVNFEMKRIITVTWNHDLHGFEEHSLISVWQLFPVKPHGHVHCHVFGFGIMQVPPLMPLFNKKNLYYKIKFKIKKLMWLTWIRSTYINLNVTVCSCEARCTNTLESIWS